jgi:gamma-glutamyl hydrolase
MLRCVALLLLCHFSCAAVNDRPVIGIMAQPIDPSLSHLGDQYLVASYVKWIEASGARVVPVLYNQSESELTKLFGQVSGIVFPGGHVGTHGTAYGNASWFLMELAQKANDGGDPFALWGTCMGFQQIVQFGSGQVEPSVLSATVGTEDLLVPLNFTDFGFTSSRLMKNAPLSVKNTLKNLPVTVNLHHYSALTSTVEKSGSELHKFFSVLASNSDAVGTKFVSLIEAHNYPFYGAQFHGEKNAFEWNQGWERNDTAKEAHSADAVEAMQYLSSFFVDAARQCSHTWNDLSPAAPLIYDFNPVSTAGTASDKWDLTYVF